MGETVLMSGLRATASDGYWFTIGHSNARKPLALAEAAVEETRTKDTVESSRSAFNRAVNLEDERKALQTARGAEEILRVTKSHRRALARGED